MQYGLRRIRSFEDFETGGVLRRHRRRLQGRLRGVPGAVHPAAAVAGGGPTGSRRPGAGGVHPRLPRALCAPRPHLQRQHHRWQPVPRARGATAQHLLAVPPRRHHRAPVEDPHHPQREKVVGRRGRRQGAGLLHGLREDRHRRLLRRRVSRACTAARRPGHRHPLRALQHQRPLGPRACAALRPGPRHRVHWKDGQDI